MSAAARTRGRRDGARALERRVRDEDAARRAHREGLAHRLGRVRRRHREERDLAPPCASTSLSAASSAYSSLPLTTAGDGGPVQAAVRAEPLAGRCRIRDGLGEDDDAQRDVNLLATGSAALAEQRPRDDQPLDLLGPLVELGDLRVAHHPLDRELVDVAVSAQDLDGIGRDPHGGVTGDEFTHGRPAAGVGRPGLDLGAGLVQELARGLGAGVHVGEHRAGPSGSRRSRWPNCLRSRA